MTDADKAPPGVDATVPSAARLYDYYLGGTDNFEVDRIAAEQIRSTMPELSLAAWANRGFLQRAARWLATEAGIRQFIDIGAGLPTRNNSHEAVHSVAPDARVVYVDNDPMVTAYAQALLSGTGNTVFLTGDLRDPEGILKDPELRKLLDLDQPVALLLAAIVHFVPDRLDPVGLVGKYLDALAPGSYLALSHATADQVNPVAVQTIRDVYDESPSPLFFRTKEQVGEFFAGLELVPPYTDGTPDVVHVGMWGGEDLEAADDDGSRWLYCGVARKP